ncbi:MAG: alpha-N-arabinofuranosidase [Phycisphaerae bacterium]|nr:alpha-N-arabinofuranosidase [Phycisphaerae bacterium]
MNRIVINADLGEQVISRHVFGHFAEHLGRCIYGGIWVGEDSPIPNVRGIRSDVVGALRAIRIPVLRWPGGCFADEYHWTDGIGPRAKRPSMVNTHWGGVVEDNSFGTHEYLDLCDQLGCEPYICGNVGSGTVREMQQWVEYLTAPAGPMADRRRAHGRPDPWKIAFWGVGNESWGCGGRMRADYYADLYRRHACYLRNFGDNRLFRIACGPSGGDTAWTEVLMREAGRHMDGLSVHHYSRFPPPQRQTATVFDEAGWIGILKLALRTEEIIASHKAVMDRYDPARRVAIIFDEWGAWWEVEPGTNPRFLYQQNTLRDAMVAAVSLDIFARHCDRVRMANLAQTDNVLQAVVLTEGEKMLLTPTYHVFDMFQVHQDATLLPLDLRCDTYTLGEVAVPTLSATASRDGSGARKVHLSLSNLDPNTPADVECVIRGRKLSGVSGRVLTAKDMNAHNTFDAPDAVRPTRFDGAKLSGENLAVALPPKSIVVLELVSP